MVLNYYKIYGCGLTQDIKDYLYFEKRNEEQSLTKEELIETQMTADTIEKITKLDMFYQQKKFCSKDAIQEILETNEKVLLSSTNVLVILCVLSALI